MTPPRERILTMNRGSATLKSALFEVGERDEVVTTISVAYSSGAAGRLKISDAGGRALLDTAIQSGEPNAALEMIFAWLEEREYLRGLTAAGHRLVHGGARYREPQRITPDFLAELEKLTPLDPDHLPAAIRGIQFVARRFPKIAQVACFDTNFHSTLPTVAKMYALPRRFYDEGVRRYGFHGLSYEYIVAELRRIDAKLAAGRVIVAHLGSGAGMVALRDGKSADTSMGFTPVEGLVMSARSGDVDPGLLAYLLAEKGMSAHEISALINKQSGLLGVSGSTGDMRELLEKAPNDSHAAEAIDLFCYRAKKYVGAYAAALGGLDGLVFTGGIGERAPDIRERICSGLEFLGIRLDAARNAANAPVISSADGRVNVRVIETNEDLMVVQHVIAVLGRGKPATD
ncbi:MAG: acetate/propionate family kinase [Candidatus Acidiferrales bacterium]